MSLKLQDPRLAPPQAADNAALARERRRLEEQLGRALIAACKRVFPGDQNMQFVATQRDGKWRIRFEPPAVHESGWTDA